MLLEPFQKHHASGVFRSFVLTFEKTLTFYRLLSHHTWIVDNVSTCLNQKKISKSCPGCRAPQPDLELWIILPLFWCLCIGMFWKTSDGFTAHMEDVFMLCQSNAGTKMTFILVWEKKKLVLRQMRNCGTISRWTWDSGLWSKTFFLLEENVIVYNHSVLLNIARRV